MTSPYAPEIVPSDLNDPLKLQAFLDREFKNISKAMDSAQTVSLDPQFVLPSKPEEGVIYYADGTSWNPGSGEGYYGYKNGIWVKLDNNASEIVSGMVVDSIAASYSTNANLTIILPGDDTIPTITEGTEILSVTITPKTITNKLRCTFMGWGTTAAATYTFCGALYQGSTAIDFRALFPTAANQTLEMGLLAEYTPGAVSAQTISVRVGPGAAGTIRMNGTTIQRYGGGVSKCTLLVEEIKA